MNLLQIAVPLRIQQFEYVIAEWNQPTLNIGIQEQF
jgi:hypothetical protein